MNRARVLPASGWALLAVLALVGGARAHADEEPRPRWAEEVQALRIETLAAKRKQRTWELLAKKPDPDRLRGELARPLPWKADAPKGLTHWQRDVGWTGTLTVYAYVPAAYTPDKAWPVLLWMHGGVMRPNDGGGSDTPEVLHVAAEANGFLVLSPSANAHTAWWLEAGIEHLRASLAELARRYHVDPDRVAAAGFSDGGAGCYHLLAHDPDPYACFVSAMGHPLATRRLGGPAFAGNCTSRPMWAINGALEGLPPEQLGTVITEMQAAGIPIQWQLLPRVGHEVRGLLGQADAMLAFWKAHPRDPLPKRVDWECVLPPQHGRRAWVEILGVDVAAPGAPDVPSRPLPMPEVKPRPRLGVALDVHAVGPGLRISSVEAGSPAHEAGFQGGDYILKAGGTELTKGEAAAAALRDYLAGLGPEEGEFLVKRRERTLTLRAKLRVLASDLPNPALGYGKPSGRVVAEVKEGNKIEVKTRGVSELRLHLARPLVDPTKELVVVLNGKEAYKGVPQVDAAYLLDQALRGLPGDPLYEANLTLKP